MVALKIFERIVKQHVILFFFKIIFQYFSFVFCLKSIFELLTIFDHNLAAN